MAASVPEKYKETITEMKADVVAAVQKAQKDFNAKQKVRINLEIQLGEMERIKTENYSKFYKVVVDLLKLLITNFFKRRATMQSFARAINPVNEYLKYSNWIEETNKQFQEAKSAEEDAKHELKAAERLLENINAIG